MFSKADVKGGPLPLSQPSLPMPVEQDKTQYENYVPHPQQQVGSGLIAERNLPMGRFF